jgi:hypothetical protein
VLNKLTGQLVDLGATLQSPDVLADARLETVTTAGVAPDEFAVTTIYPTEVRAGGEWLPVREQRMDAVIVVNRDEKKAHCRLLRDLRQGDEVVVGVEGIRLARAPESRLNDGEPSTSTSSALWARACPVSAVSSL